METKSFNLILIILFVYSCLFAAQEPAAETNSPALALQEAVGVTVYNNNFAVIKEQRPIPFNKGLNTIRFTDVASAIEPASVSFQCLSSPGRIAILEQNYEYDLVSTSSLLNRYLDKTVNVSIKGSGADQGKNVSGVLMAARDNNLILKNINGRVEIISSDSVENISLEQLPEDLVTKPTLIWLAQAEAAGKELCRVTYTTDNIAWKADYSAILNAVENALDISGWVTINNQSGATYKDATIRLIAGDVRRVEEPQPREMMKHRALDMAAGAPAFE